MDIKGVVNLKKNAQDLKKSIEQKVSKPKSTQNPISNSNDNVEIKMNPGDSRIKKMMVEIRTIQDNVSKKQAYLSNLNQAKSELLGNKDLMQIQRDLMTLRKKANFNKQPLLNEVIPGDAQYFESYDNVKAVRTKVANEIERTKRNIGKSQNMMSRFSISIENIRASLNSNDVKKLQTIFNNKPLYRNVNKDNVINLIS